MNPFVAESLGRRSAWLADFEAWRFDVVARTRFACAPIRFSESSAWHFDDGILRHDTGGFFSVAGIRARARQPDLDGLEQVIILQPEVAINGFLLRQGPRGPELLFQGRVEPGNVGVMQLAPTVQSTESNYKGVHGGNPTPYIQWFTKSGAASPLFDELQSEEGSRYLGKFNRNVVLEVPPYADVAAHPNYRWYGLDAIRSFLATSNVVNTDARSVLSCLAWEHLAGTGRLFDGLVHDAFRTALLGSYQASIQTRDRDVAGVLTWLARKRAQAGLRTTVVPLPALSNWTVGDDVIGERRVRSGFVVRQYRVTAVGREVQTWDQPLIDSVCAGRLSLVCQERERVLRFLVKASREIGFVDGVQLSTTVVVAPGESFGGDSTQQELVSRIDDGRGVALHLRCRQSEEGGRFFQDENDYEVVELDPGTDLRISDDYRWLTLRTIKELTRVPGAVSMELRGVLATLLAFA